MSKPIQEVLVKPKDTLNTLLKSDLKKSQSGSGFLQKVETNVLNMNNMWQAQRKKAMPGIPQVKAHKNAP